VSEKDIQGEVFASFGECIYCGSTEELTDEHIVPLSLDGKAVIKDGSCTSCAAITSYLDGYLARHTFYHMRVHRNMHTRRKHPNQLPLSFSFDNERYEKSIPVEDHPYFVHLPIWGKPTLFTSNPPSTEFGPVTAQMFWYIPDTIRKTLNLADGQEVELFPEVDTVNVHTFARAIAKIAYCHAVLDFHLKGFRPLALPDIILGRYPHPAIYIGSKAIAKPPDRKGPMHRITRLQLHDYPYSVISVQLFSHSGTDQNAMPVYHVVVGIPRKPKSRSRLCVIKTEKVICL
jgi:hypothetical protein